jgi:3'(2'), 5'-bisphosphate nucleotidase
LLFYRLQASTRILYTPQPAVNSPDLLPMIPKSLIKPVVALSVDAGRSILAVYETNFEVAHKADESPLTKADMASTQCILQGLRALTPDLPIITEEAGLAPFEVRRGWSRYWLIDPLDGTKEFVSRNGEFTVNIALIENGKPILGVVHVPVTGKTYIGCKGAGAEVQQHGGQTEALRVASASGNPVRVVGSRSHRGASLDAFLAALDSYEMHPMGSSLKFCVIAEGRADVYPRLGPTSEWDTAAAQAVVEQAGGQVLRLDGKPLNYNGKDDILNPHFLVAGPQDHDWLGLLAAPGH